MLSTAVPPALPKLRHPVGGVERDARIAREELTVGATIRRVVAFDSARHEEGQVLAQGTAHRTREDVEALAVGRQAEQAGLVAQVAAQLAAAGAGRNVDDAGLRVAERGRRGAGRDRRVLEAVGRNGENWGTRRVADARRRLTSRCRCECRSGPGRRRCRWRSGRRGRRAPRWSGYTAGCCRRCSPAPRPAATRAPAGCDRPAASAPCRR